MSDVVDTHVNPSLARRDIILCIVLAGTSGAAVLAETFTPVPMTMTAPFIVLPSAFLVIAMMFRWQGRPERVAFVGDRMLLGAKWGLIATLAYDAVRPVLLAALQLEFNPYRAIPLFGALATGRPSTDGMAIGIGWLYHFWNGITFGMMFALARPRGGWLAGLIWGLGLQALMMWAYPDLLQVRLDDPGFLVSTIVGHSLWGVVLGAGLAWEGRRDNRRVAAEPATT